MPAISAARRDGASTTTESSNGCHFGKTVSRNAATMREHSSWQLVKDPHETFAELEETGLFYATTR
jgi:hypothetical protein